MSSQQHLLGFDDNAPLRRHFVRCFGWCFVAAVALLLPARNALAANPEVALLVENPSGPVTPGQTVVYRIHIANRSTTTPSPALNLEANVPQYVAVNQPPGGTCAPSRCDYTYVVRFGAVVHWAIPSMAPGESTARDLRTVIDNSAEFPPPPNGTKIKLDVTLKTGVVKVAEASGFVVATPTLPTLDLEVTGTTRAAPGKAVEYTFRYGNGGLKSAPAVLRVPLPAKTSVLKASKGAVEKDGAIEWDLGKLPAGFSDARTLQLELDKKLTPSSLIAVEAELKSSAQKYPASAMHVTLAAPAAPLLLAITATPDPATPGNVVLYKIEVTNKSPTAPTGDFQLQSTIPRDVSINQPQGGSCWPTRCDYTYTARYGAYVLWTIKSLPPGATTSVQFTARIDKPVDAAPPPSGSIITNELLAVLNGLVRSDLTVAVGTPSSIGKGAPLVSLDDKADSKKKSEEKSKGESKPDPKSEKPKAEKEKSEPQSKPSAESTPASDSGKKKSGSGVSVKVSGSVDAKTK